jgi:hypothetical protein
VEPAPPRRGRRRNDEDPRRSDLGPRRCDEDPHRGTVRCRARRGRRPSVAGPFDRAARLTRGVAAACAHAPRGALDLLDGHGLRSRRCTPRVAGSAIDCYGSVSDDPHRPPPSAAAAAP